MTLRWMRLLTGRVICSCLFAIIQAVAGEILCDLWCRRCYGQYTVLCLWCWGNNVESLHSAASLTISQGREHQKSTGDAGSGVQKIYGEHHYHILSPRPV